MAARKKVSQEELRRLMSVARGAGAGAGAGRVEHPLAKYGEGGALSCALCRCAVRSAPAWAAHLNSARHREAVAEARRLKDLTRNFTAPPGKRGAVQPPAPPPAKKVRGILKNAPPRLPSDFFQKPELVPAPVAALFHDEEIKRAPIVPLPAPVKEDPQTSAEKETETKFDTAPDQPIPEGFFDDPILDAKARNIEYKDPIEEEWEKFQKEMKEETSASAEIIAGEQEEATAERQIDEIDEQIRNWSRVLDLELKKEETTKLKQEHASSAMENDDASGSDTDIDEYLDWRAKKSYR